jgi:hypothetical protein
MTRTEIDNALQWAGTACLLSMYVLMSFFPHLHPWNIVAGVLGGSCYLLWTVRVRNRPQMLVNGVAIAISLAGLFKAWG